MFLRGNELREENLRPVYVPGMGDRGWKDETPNPGPDTYELKTCFGEGPKIKMSTQPRMKAKDKSAEIPNCDYTPQLPPSGPHYSIMGAPSSDVTSKNHLNPKKTRDPGPGQYSIKDT